jgi:plastocyanin
MTATITSRLLVLLAGTALAACTSAAGITGPPPTAPPGGAVIVAQGIVFDRARLVVPADTSFALLFENRDGALHNVTIYDDAGGQPMFVGEVFTGPGSRSYAVPAIRAGTHRFRCDVHPQMSGTLEAGPG